MSNKNLNSTVHLVEDEKEDVENDYKYSRENYYNLIERGQEAIDGDLDIREGQHSEVIKSMDN